MIVSEEIKKIKKIKKHTTSKVRNREKNDKIRESENKTPYYYFFFHPDPLRFYCANKIVALL